MSGLLFNPPSETLFQNNAIVSGRNRSYLTGPLDGSLSIKTVLNGSGVWWTPDGRYEVSPDSCLVLNHGQTYGVEIESEDPVQTFCVFFAPGLVESITGGNPFGFYEHLHLKAAGMDAPLKKLQRLFESEELGSLEADEAIVEMAEALVRAETGKVEVARLEHTKESTRDEVHRMLRLARDYAISNLDKRIGLNDLAGVAALSAYHFHRLHVQAFRETPHQFLTRARIERAKRLLREGKDLGDVSLALGFESVPTFARLFKSKVGCTPGAFRKIG